MWIAITGASGLIGRRLVKVLGEAGHQLTVFSRHAVADLPGNVRLALWRPGEAPPAGALMDADAIVHLAGENVAQRWTADAKRRIRDSRVEGTRTLVETLAALPRRPGALVCASAVGYYGSRGDEILDERSAPGTGFLPEVCVGWEREAQAAEALGLRVARLRIGIALDSGGGALARMLPPFRMGAGGRLGDGRQWMSWIHLDDLAELFRFVLESGISGPVNGVAPNPARNADFTKALAHAINRPAMLPVPEFALRLLFGEMAEVLLGSQRVAPRAALEAGFRFRRPELETALADLLK
jgi:uncharacterized protein (TIGR01777 family)